MLIHSIYRATGMLALIALAACQTTAQNERVRIQKQIDISTNQAWSCWDRVNSHPDLHPLQKKFTFGGRGSYSVPLALRLVDEKATDEEIILLHKRHSLLAECRKIAIEGLGKAHPSYAAFLIPL